MNQHHFINSAEQHQLQAMFGSAVQAALQSGAAEERFHDWKICARRVDSQVFEANYANRKGHARYSIADAAAIGGEVVPNRLRAASLHVSIWHLHDCVGSLCKRVGIDGETVMWS